ncbi:hypothetical protein FOWG_17399 [Fusarium oxysporum f. sp. lycopersici MN25]|nr:hypothetical protein FOWG_17399 [Fusarium oxysporum f. sp. lycopersici MN25]
MIVQNLHFSRLTFDTSHSPNSLNLPSYLFANHCLEQMEIYMGPDYHWFLRRRFKERMDLTYKTSGSLESRDRLWPCRLLIAFALGETFVNYHLGPTANQPDGQDPHQEQDTVITPPPPPGTAFFEQALVLLKLPFEDPSLEHIEILNLASFYSYSLNWKRAAYMYAGMSVRMCNLLELHQSPSQTYSELDKEHRKRVCWTSYCPDKMASSELGLLPSFQPSQIKLDYPSDQQLEPGDQFCEADFLRARIQLTLMKAEADIFIDLWQSIRDDIPEGERRVRPILLRLENWLHELPQSLKFDCEAGMPEAMAQAPNMRSLASLYLRW